MFFPIFALIVIIAHVSGAKLLDIVKVVAFLAAVVLTFAWPPFGLVWIAFLMVHISEKAGLYKY